MIPLAMFVARQVRDRDQRSVPRAPEPPARTEPASLRVAEPAAVPLRGAARRCRTVTAR